LTGEWCGIELAGKSGDGGSDVKVNVGKSVVELVQGDITDMDTEAIVNAANTSLQLGGGVAGAIRRKGGPTIQEECDRIGGTFVGGAVITTGGNLKAKYIIHAAGPKTGEQDENNKLKMATLNSLKLADENKVRSISFPAISTGIFGFPIGRCAMIMLGTVLDYLRGQFEKKPTVLERVVFCLYTASDYKVFEDTLNRFK